MVGNANCWTAQLRFACATYGKVSFLLLEFAYSDAHNKVRAYERDALSALEKLTQRYSEIIGQMKCKFILRPFWIVANKKVVNTPPCFDLPFSYWIEYSIVQDGKMVIYDAENSATNRAYFVLGVEKNENNIANSKQVTVRYFPDIGDIEEELQKDIQLLREIIGSR